jgi:hypothetical protein
MGWVYHASPEVQSASEYPEIIAVCITLTLLMALTVSTRIAVRWTHHRTGPDDYIMAVAMVGLGMGVRKVAVNYRICD